MVTEYTPAHALDSPPHARGVAASVRTFLAGGNAHGQNVMHTAGGRCQLQGTRYRHFSGPYGDPRRGAEAYQVFVAEGLDDVSAREAVVRLLHERPG